MPETTVLMPTEPREPTPPGNSDPVTTKKSFGRRNAQLATITALTYVVFLLLMARIPGGDIGLIAVTTLLSLFFTLLFTVLMARSLTDRKSLAVAALISIAAIVPSIIIPLLVRMHPEWPIWGPMGPRYKAYRGMLRLVPGEDSLIMVTAAVSIGVGISRLVKEFKMLLPIAVMLAVVDLYVVFGGGLVTQAQHGSPVAAHLMNSLTVQLPTVHPARGVAPMQLAVGFADYLFIGLFFACFAKFKAPAKKTFLVLFAVLAGYMMVVAFRNIALPALVPIGVVVIGMHIKRFEYKRDELFALLYAGIIVGVIGTIFYIKSRIGAK